MVNKLKKPFFFLSVIVSLFGLYKNLNVLHHQRHPSNKLHNDDKPKSVDDNYSRPLHPVEHDIPLDSGTLNTSGITSAVLIHEDGTTEDKGSLGPGEF